MEESDIPFVRACPDLCLCPAVLPLTVNADSGAQVAGHNTIPPEALRFKLSPSVRSSAHEYLQGSDQYSPGF